MFFKLLFEERYSFTIIKKERCEKHGFNIFTSKINNIINMKRNKYQSLLLTGKRAKNAYPTMIRTPVSHISHFERKDYPSKKLSQNL